ncbi:MAG: hypothetical protein AAGA30_15290 [Planctomycetota bacterium]
MTKKVLDSEKIVSTISRLQSRIEERFPKSGLSQVAETLEQIAVNARSTSTWIEKPVWWLRLFVWLGCLLFLVTAVCLTYLAFQPLFHGGQMKDLLSNVETEINFMILIGGATLFTWTLESRYKRWKALQALHELRSVAHVVDMHQLTKDPDRIFGAEHDTSSSPKFKMTSYELRRYLDYCSEMLSLIGKVAALYVQKFDDPVALSAASEIEHTATGLSRKIWQKLMILHAAKAEGRAQ